MPPEGMDRRHYFDAKFGSAERASRIYDVMRAAGAAEGITFAFERIKRTPNTLKSHRLLRLAATHGQQEIGRASRRERVCQYVSISVVAGTLNKKHQRNKGRT